MNASQITATVRDISDNMSDEIKDGIANAIAAAIRIYNQGGEDALTAVFDSIAA